MTALTDLSHVSRPLPNGGKVFVLDTGAIIGPEAQAMLGALHSRNPNGIENHLKILAKKGAESFMQTFYVGYGHKSIADLGAVTVAIEGVSMLAAKAIQDFPLYNGQEVSTRYVDFSTQPFIHPVDDEIGRNIHAQLRSFYLGGLSDLIPDLKRRFPMNSNEDAGVYEKAIKARAFDIMRAFLPAGASTNLVWFGELRQFADRLPLLRNHPLEEVRQIGVALLQGLLTAFPSSFSEKQYPDTEEYIAGCQTRYAYLDHVHSMHLGWANRVDRKQLAEYTFALNARPPKAELPWEIRECGTMQFEFHLDFGSFRDLQRHRGVITRMPMLVAENGFEQWYINELPEHLRARASILVEDCAHDLEKLGRPGKWIRQYYLPMGTLSPIRMTGDLRGLVYLLELRSTRFVHHTLRMRAQQIAEVLLKEFGSAGLVLHLDKDPNRFDVERGTHDLTDR